MSTLKRRGLLVSDNTQQAEILNEQFKSVFSQENTTAPPELEGDPFLSMPEVNIEVTGVEKLLQNLNPGKALGPDSVPNSILKLCAKELAPMLTFIFNQSLSLGVLPADWNLADITPTFKKGDRHLPENNRPVSLTSVPYKILEHIVCRHTWDKRKFSFSCNTGFAVAIHAIPSCS